MQNQDIFFRCVEDCNEAIMMSDKNGILVYVNPAWQRIYGYTAKEAVGKTPKLLHSGSQSKEFYAEMWRQILDPSIAHWKGELLNKAKDGTLVPVLLTINPIRGKDEEIKGFMGIALDMTRAKELEAKVSQQDRLASIGMLASGLAHEIGTPLGVVRGRAEFLLMKAESPTVSKNLDVIISQIDRISKLIRSLLRVGREFSDAKIEPVRIRETIEEVFALVGQNLKEEGAEFRIQVEPDLRVQADFGRLEQIFLNLIINSVHAIRMAKQDGRQGHHFVEIGAQAGNGKVSIDVRDTGCGIPPENMKKLFRPFFTTKDIGEGTGLGLAIVSQLIHEMKGKILVKSVVNEGTTFTIVLDSAG